MLMTKTAKTVTNISKLSSTHFVSIIRHQHRCSPASSPWKLWIYKIMNPCSVSHHKIYVNLCYSACDYYFLLHEYRLCAPENNNNISSEVLQKRLVRENFENFSTEPRKRSFMVHHGGPTWWSIMVVHYGGPSSWIVHELWICGGSWTKSSLIQN